MTEDLAMSGPDPDVAAAELALGLLEGEDRAVALRRILADPAFAREVEQWRVHFGTLFGAVRPIAPSSDHGDRVIARLDQPERRAPAYWKPFAIASSLAAASLFGVIIARPTPDAPPPVVRVTPAPMVAAFMIEGQSGPIVATLDAAHARLSMPGPMPIPDGKSAQLWAIGANGIPQPLGLFHSAGNRVEADARSAEAIEPGITFAISIEPLGGSPTGAPTGPVVGSATLIRA